MILRLLWGLLFYAWQANAAAVFAHFMVGNTASYSRSTWDDEIRLAQEAHIDAFALNIAKDAPMNGAQIENAFAAANGRGFKLFFSFDYAGRGPWERDKVLELLRGYFSNGAYYKENGLPLVSTFEGWQQSQDWKIIKSQYNCLFVPDWSSLGAVDAVIVGQGIIDGLFNWAAWPNIDNGMPAMDTYVDASFYQFLNGLSYMMPVSPWFYANMPGYDKNWKWQSDTLWFDRWHQALVVKPRWIEIISWNDYGESHYIGPLRSEALGDFDASTGKPPFNYAKDMAHDGWRSFLPYAIDLYKSGTATITKEGVTAWYRLQTSQSACSDGDTTTNTATHLQLEHPASAGQSDGVYFAALLSSFAFAEVKIGSTVVSSTWTFVPDGGVGIWRGFAPSSAQGPVTVNINRNGATIATVTGDQSIGGCQNGFYNFNAIVKTQFAAGTISATPALRVQDQGCIEGTGKGEYKSLCEYTCALDYCPVTACLCTKLGAKVTKPRGTPGYAAHDPNFSGLCNVACSYGYCPSQWCDTVEHSLQPIPGSPFTPPSCRSGTGTGQTKALCEFTCKWGYCPIKAGCSCSETGTLRTDRPAETDMKPRKTIDNLAVRLLCNFSCKFGYCEQDGVCNDLRIPPWPEPADEGEYFPKPGLGWPATDDRRHTTYVTILNATPDDFILTGNNSYQINPFDFKTVKSCQSRQNKQEYNDGAYFVDDKGEAYYTIGNTGNNFDIYARTHYGNLYDMREIFNFSKFSTKDVSQGQSFELGRHSYRSYNFAITGSKKYGYWTSLNPPTAWMSTILDVIGERKVKHISMIGSHDAGIYKVSRADAFVTEANCQAQGLDIHDQLVVGSRWFDIRPEWRDGQFVTFHGSSGFSCNGGTIKEIIDSINTFTATNPELIFLYISHATNMDDKWENLFDVFEGLNNRCPNFSGDLADKKVNDFIGNGRACVIVIVDNDQKSRPAKGIYNRSQFNSNGEGHWSNMNDGQAMAEDQIAYHTKDHAIGAGAGDKDKFYVMQWIVTLKGIDNADPDENPISIEAQATRMAYDTIWWKGWSSFTPYAYPQVMLMDFVGVLQEGDRGLQQSSKELITLAMSVNLGIASRNMYVGGGNIYT